MAEIKHLQAINEQGQNANAFKNEKINELQSIKEKLKEGKHQAQTQAQAQPQPP